MKTSDFYYDLHQELIAQTPVEPTAANWSIGSLRICRNICAPVTA